MKKILLSVCLLLSFISLGQCPSDDIYLTSQAEIDAFATAYPNCTNLIESLNIDGNDITNLNGLSQIQDVAGGIYIHDTNIQDFSGFENIQNLSSSLLISINYSLTSFNGLNNLETIRGQFAVGLNNGLVNFSGLNSLISVGNGSDLGFLIADNDNLVSFEGLENLNEIYGKLDLNNNESLLNLTGLEDLNFIFGYISIRENLSLQSFEGLNNLNYCREYLEINENEALTSISALSNLDSSEIIGVFIENNIQLPYCSITPICNSIINPNTDVSIFNNSQGCNTVPEVEAQCQLSITETDISENLSLFPNPVSSILKIKTSNHIFFEKATVYSLLGKRVFETSSKQINLENLSAGIYFVKVVTNKGSVTKKIVKE